MSTSTPDCPNLWALTILCLLRQRPMHPYEIQRLIREYHKDAFLDLKRGSLYHAIGQLRDAGGRPIRSPDIDGSRLWTHPCAPPFAAVFTNTRPPFGPGSAPLISSNPDSTST